MSFFSGLSIYSYSFFGLLKEAIDATQKNKFFDKNDVMADLAGASAFQVTFTIPLNIKIRRK